MSINRLHEVCRVSGTHRPGRPAAGGVPAQRRKPAAPHLVTVRQAVTGPLRSLAHTPFLTARQVWLETDSPLQLDVDGEIRGRTPAQITLEANALRVLVRPDFPDV